jgi:hypothetical protein
MRDLTLSDFTRLFKKKNYLFYAEGHYNLNLMGVRSADSQSDKFDDCLHVIYRDYDNMFKHHKFEFTSDPGKNWLLKPMNIGGCAILIPGQYKSVYKIGTHKGYRALEQVGDMWYVRDNNLDTQLDFDLYRDPEKRKKHAFVANIKSNIHRASALSDLFHVGVYSAGCQVLRKEKDFDILMFLAEKQVREEHGNLFSYTLTEASDFE